MSDVGLGGHEVDGDIAAGFEFFHGILRSGGRRVVAHDATSGACLDDLFDGIISGNVGGWCGVAWEDGNDEKDRKDVRLHGQ